LLSRGTGGPSTRPGPAEGDETEVRGTDAATRWRTADGAVDADDGRPTRLERRRELFRRRAVERVAILLGRHLRDDRQVRNRAHRVQGRANLVEIAERFEDEQVDAAFGERLGLLPEVVARLVDAGLPPRLDANAERAD